MSRNRHLEVISLLVAKGVELDVTEKDLKTPLHFAAKGGHSEVVKALLKAKPGNWVNEKCRGNCSPLAYAIHSDSVETVRVLVQNGASMAAGANGVSDFKLAADKANAGIVGVFMEMGAAAALGSRYLGQIGEGLIVSRYDLSAKVVDTLRALITRDPAYQTDGDTSLATQLLLYAARYNPLAAAEILVDLVDLGADVSDGEAIQVAFCCNSQDAAKAIFPHAPTVLRIVATKMFFSAAAGGDADSVRCFLTHRVPANATDARGKTALHHAAANGHAGILAALLEVNSTPGFVNARSSSGATALYDSAEGASHIKVNCNLDAVKMLVEHGADLTLMKGGLTPLDVARASEVRWIVKYLEGVSGSGT